jgi:hypothetical protein
VLTFFNRILLQPQSITAKVITRQLATKNLDSASWASHVRILLHRYSLPSAYCLLEYTPSKSFWKKMVRTAVHEYWLKELKQEAAKKSTLKYLFLDGCTLTDSHPLWNLGIDPLTIHMAATHAQLLVQRYPIASLQYSGSNKDAQCPLCNSAEETIPHFMLHCASLASSRKTPLVNFLKILESNGFPPPHDDCYLIQLILDPTYILGRKHYLIGLLLQSSRRLCFTLHSTRSQLTGYNEQFSLARRKAKNA